MLITDNLCDTLHGSQVTNATVQHKKEQKKKEKDKNGGEKNIILGFFLSFLQQTFAPLLYE